MVAYPLRRLLAALPAEVGQPDGGLGHDGPIPPGAEGRYRWLEGRWRSRLPGAVDMSPSQRLQQRDQTRDPLLRVVQGGGRR